VHLLDQAMLVYLVMVEEDAARGLAHTDAFAMVDPRAGTEVIRKQIRVVQPALDPLDGRQDLDQPGVMIEKRGVGRVLSTVTELPQLPVGQRRAHVRTNVDAGQRTNAIDALRITERLVVGKLQVRPRLDRFAKEILVARRVEMVGDKLALAIHHTDLTIVMFPAAVRTHEPHEERWKFAESVYLFLIVLQQA